MPQIGERATARRRAGDARYSRIRSLTSCRARLRLVAAALALAGCTSSDEGSTATVREPKKPYPVTVASCGRETTYQRAPARAVANDINMTEMMLALGLSDRMAGVAGVAGPDTVRADLRGEFARVELLSDSYIQLEALVSVNADFLLAGWNYGLGAGGITPNALAARNINTYELTESCAHVVPGKATTSIEETFGDLRNLGRIFNVERRAETLIAAQRRVLDHVSARVSGRKPVKVLVYDSGEEEAVTAPGLAVATDLLARGGGANVFADLRKTWSTVAWREAAARDPECVLIVDGPDAPSEEKRNTLKRTRAMRGTTAVKDDCFIVLPYAALVPGVRNADAVKGIAEKLHPEAFAR